MWQAQEGSIRKEASRVGAVSPMSPAVPGINAVASAQRCSICPGGVARLLLNPLAMFQYFHNGCGRTPCLAAKNRPLDVSSGDREGGREGKKSQVEAVVEKNNSQRLFNQRAFRNYMASYRDILATDNTCKQNHQRHRKQAK